MAGADRPSTITLAAHARRGSMNFLAHNFLPKRPLTPNLCMKVKSTRNIQNQ